jgi:hypothetical protein
MVLSILMIRNQKLINPNDLYKIQADHSQIKKNETI